MGRIAVVLGSALAIAFAGLLWAVASLPLLTCVPATAALFGVFAEWDPGRPAPPVWSTFLRRFTRHLKQAFGIGLLLIVVLAVLVVDLWYGLYAPNAPLRPVVLGAGILGLVLLAGTTVFLFPVMTALPHSWWRYTLRNSALLAGAYVWSTLLGLFCWAVVAVVIYNAPALVPFAVGFGAFAVSRVVGRALERYELTYGSKRAAEPDD